ncbi:MAG: hypothetical protein Q4C84_06635 [Bacillota bacterium]|nr:hypothetical protein [Bacillota bacterium]
MELKIRVANPAGNVTIFVMSPAKREEYPAISRELLCMEELHGEQVGFVEETQDGSFHMEMMGGEFCGNATRSFGYLLSMLSQEKTEEVWVDVSGSQKKLKVAVDLEKGTARTEMPLPLEIKEITVKGESFSMIVFEGICHIMVDSAPKAQEFVDELIEEAKQACLCDAYGVMFLEGKQMTPVVYVESTASMVWESSCGSGSMGAAVYLSKAADTGEFVYEFYQPGGMIEAYVKKEEGKVISCKMGGPVTISEEMKVDIG